MASMPHSQNALFGGAAPPDPEFDHPAGASIVRAIQRGLLESEWLVGDLEDWRDCGWSIRCSRGEAEADVVVTDLGPAEWFLQIHPTHTPGILGRLMGKRPSAHPDDVLRLSLAVDSLLRVAGYTALRWRWDGYPEDDRSTPRPCDWRRPG